MKRTLLTLVTTSLVLVAEAAETNELEKTDDGGLKIEASMDVLSDYVWRGTICNGNPVWQPSVTLGYDAGDLGSVSANVWSSYDLTHKRGTSNNSRRSCGLQEIDYTLADGVEIEYSLGVAELTPDGPLFRERTFDEEGHVTSEGEPALYPADTTIIAASQTTKSKIVNTTTGLDLNDKGLIAVHGNGETSRAGVFSGGDVVLGPWNVIQTVKNSKLVAEAMDRYLTAKRQG